MTISPRVWEFPDIPIAKQLFHVPGAVSDGGMTTGGARISSPEPGGFAMLEIQPAPQLGEWKTPLASWLMSKTNGQILRVRLALTPQLANLPEWDGELTTKFTEAALVGTTVAIVDVSEIGQILRIGHLIGHGYNTHKIDEIVYNPDSTAGVIVTPPFRRNVLANDTTLLRPWFTGSIVNASDFRNTYDAEMGGVIQLEKIVLTEVIVP